MITFILISIVAFVASDCNEDKTSLLYQAKGLNADLKYCFKERAEAQSKITRFEENLSTSRNEMEQWKAEMGGVQKGHKIMTQGKLYNGWKIKLDIKPVGTRPTYDYKNGNILFLQTVDEAFVTGLWFSEHLHLKLY